MKKQNESTQINFAIINLLEKLDEKDLISILAGIGIVGHMMYTQMEFTSSQSFEVMTQLYKMFGVSRDFLIKTGTKIPEKSAEHHGRLEKEIEEAKATEAK